MRPDNVLRDNAAVDRMITSFANPAVKRIRALRDRKHRRREGAFVVEGLQPVWRAVTSGWPIETLVIAESLLQSNAAREMVGQQRDFGVEVLDVSGEVFQRLSDRDGPAGLLAVVRGSVPPLAAFAPRLAGPVVALHRAGNPGNIGTVFRSADAAGAAGLIVVGAAADPLAPGAIKAGMGSVFAVPCALAADEEELFGWATAAGRTVVAVTGDAEASLWDTSVDAACVLLFGSEGAGLPPEVVRRCAQSLRIPMEGTAQSLNLAAAAAVVLFELKRRRDPREGAAGA